MIISFFIFNMSSSSKGAEENDAVIITQEEAIASKCKLFNGVYPTAASPIAKLFSAPLDEQVQAADKLAKYIMDNLDEEGEAKHDFHAFNSTEEISKIPFLIPIKDSRNVRVVYGVGTGKGINGIDETEIEENVMCLSGEYIKNVQMPDVLTLPSSTIFLSPYI